MHLDSIKNRELGFILAVKSFHSIWEKKINTFGNNS